MFQGLARSALRNIVERGRKMPPSNVTNNWHVNSTYDDKGSWRNPNDQFMRFLHNGARTIANSGGIRWQKFTSINPKEPDTKQKIPPYVVLITAETATQHHNPWSDIVSYSSGEIIYWGDAKAMDPPKPWFDFRGNKMIWAVNHLRLSGDRELVPPFLHFIKPAQGKVKFSGLCALRDCALAWHGEEGRPIRNLRVTLDILDTEIVDPAWLVSRSNVGSKTDLLGQAPKVWRDAANGKIRPLRLWRSGVRSKEEQLPIVGSDDEKLLGQIRKLGGFEFERLTVAIVDLIPEIIPGLIHEVKQTKLVGDRGLDMFGFFKLPEPVSYVIPFKGEAKNWGSAVQPKDVSRLVSRLQRGEHGLFFTTSWYTEQAQDEVLKDQYPVRLFSGLDIVDLLRRANRAHESELDKDWLNAVFN
jgi:hypothetical protein